MIEREEQSVFENLYTLEHPVDIPWYFSPDSEWWWTGVVVPIVIAIVIAVIQKMRKPKND